MPDNLLPADSFRSTDPATPVRLDIPETGSPADRRPPVSIPTLLAATAREAPDHTAMAVKRDGAWLKWTYQNYLSEVRTVAKAFIKLGLQPANGVGIIGEKMV